MLMHWCVGSVELLVYSHLDIVFLSMNIVCLFIYLEIEFLSTMLCDLGGIRLFAPLDTVIRLYSLRSYCEQSWFINFPFRWLMARLQKHNWSLCTVLTLSNLFEFIRSHSFPVYFVGFLYIGLCYLQTDIICTFLFNCDAFIPFSCLIALVSAMLTRSGECRLPCCSPDLG